MINNSFQPNIEVDQKLMKMTNGEKLTCEPATTYLYSKIFYINV